MKVQLILPFALLITHLFLFEAVINVNNDQDNNIWVTVKVEYYVNESESLKQAELTLLNKAREEAVQKVTGIDIRAIRMNLTSSSTDAGGREEWIQVYQSLHQQTVNGRIIDEDPPIITREIRNGKLLLLMDYRARVNIEADKPDPLFKVDFDVNRTTYRTGESVVFRVNSSLDAYLSIFSILEDGTASMIFPNPYFTKNALLRQQNRLIPSIEESYAAEFTVIDRDLDLPHYQEMILAVATKEPFSFMPLQNTLQYNTSLIEINKWLAGIPRDQRVEVYATYVVMP